MYMVHSIMHINTKTCDFMNNQSLLFVKLIMDLEMACICIQIMRNENSCDSIIFFFYKYLRYHWPCGSWKVYCCEGYIRSSGVIHIF
jgi:hypothetical protein